jgi:iron complex transport system ATP-binding protein
LTDALSAERITFAYPGRPLFHELSLALSDGELAGLIGPNGSGKTTLLRILTGIVRPDSGRVILLGEDLEHLTPRGRARILAVVPQESRLLFDYTVLEVALMGRFAHLGLLGMETREDTEIAERCLAEVGMEQAASRPLNELSSGERQRVYVARALAQQPRVLLLDEPTSFLDLKHRLQIYEILARLNRERKLAVLVISHDLNLAARYCRRLHLIREGALAASGPPSEVITGAVIREVYGTDAEVGRDPRTGSPFIIPYPAVPQGGAP